MKRWVPISIFAIILFLLHSQQTYAETLEEQMNNLIGPQKQYNTMLSPVYLRTNTNEESISPQSGELSLIQTDYVLPGRNGLDLEIKRIYKSGVSNVQEMNVRYVNGAWVDYVQSDAKTSSFYEDRYNLGTGTRFSFPSIEVRTNEDGSSHRFLHTESGDVYRLKQSKMDGQRIFLPEGQTVKDVVVRETSEFNNGQSDGVSMFVMAGKDGKKTYFSDDGRILGIVDRYDNSIVFRYSALSYTIDATTIQKKLISSITDTIGRVTTIDYKQDDQFMVEPVTNPSYSAEERYKASQNPNNVDSGDLQGKFQVVIHLPNGKEIVYDKTAVLVSPSKHVIRTRLQRVFDADGLAKFHFWYEQPDLGFTFANGTQYSAYNRYENLVQIDYFKTNRMTRYIYNSYTKGLSQGSMQYRKIFEKRELVKTGYDPVKTRFEDRFAFNVKDKTTYEYTHEADGFGYTGYIESDDNYLRDTYRYFTEISDYRGSRTKFTYDGLHQLIVTEKLGKEHKELIYNERDEMKLVKKQESQLYQTENGQASGSPVKRIENFRYDEYGNLTNYTGPEAPRDDKGVPLNTEHTVVYTYAYDKFHVLSSKTWKKDANTTSQILYTVDGIGNITKETKINTGNANSGVVTDYQYDSYGNVTRKSAQSGEQTFVTDYEYGIDANGADVKGAYLTKEFSTLDDTVIAKKYGYDINTGNRTTEVDPRENKTVYKYDILNRLVNTAKPEGVVETYDYEENPFANLTIRHTDGEQFPHRYEFDIKGSLVKSSVFDQGKWVVLQAYAYEFTGNKMKETDANGHSIRYEYDSADRLVKKSFYQNDTVLKGSIAVGYQFGYDNSTPLLVTMTDEEGYPRKHYYDILYRLVKKEATPDRVSFYANTYAYDYTGNIISDTDARNHTTGYEYDDLGRVIAKKDALGNETKYEYNALDKVILQQEPGGKVTGLAYDALGRITEQKVYTEGSADYTYTRYDYDSAGNVVTMKQGTVADGADSLSSDTGYSYDGMNRMTDEYRRLDAARTGHVQNEYDKNGNKTRSFDYADAGRTKYRTYSYIYDYAGKVKEEKGSYREEQADRTFSEYGKYQILYERDYAGNVLKQQAANGNGFDMTIFAYDHRNQLTKKSEPYGGNPEGKRTRYTYDKAGRLLAETLTVQGVDATVFQTVDGLGRTTAKIDPLGNITRYVYDANGNRIKEIDARYSALPASDAPGIEYEYDKLNRPVLLTAYDGQTREVIGYKKYDGRGNVVLESAGEGYNPSRPEESYGNVYAYDVNDRKITFVSAQTLADNVRHDTDYVTARYEYDGNGNVISETDALGRKTRYAYYLNGLLKEKTFPDVGKETYDYDLTGKAMMVSTDRKERVTQTFQTVFDKPYRIEYPDGTVERMGYSPKGKLVKRIDQAGHTHYFDYDFSGNLIGKKEFISVDASYTAYRLTELRYDEANRLLSSETFKYLKPGKTGLGETKTSAGDRTDYFYDKAGRLLRVSGPNGRETVQEYDATGSSTEKRQKISEGNYDVTRFSYDLRQRKISETLLVKMTDLSESELAEAEYDDEYFDRVLSKSTYSYDKDGNVTSQTDAKAHKTLFEYDLDNRPTKKIDPLQAATEYRYDRKGNLTEEIDAKGVSTAYEYDELDRLIRKKAPDAGGSVATTRYVYDGVGNLIKQISPNHYDPSLDNDSSVLTMTGIGYTYDPMDRLTATVSPGGKGLQYIQYDSLGQAAKIVDGLRYNGNMASSAGESFVYDGLGSVTKRTDALGYSTSYEYDVLGNVTRMTNARKHSTGYAYNSDGTVRQVTFADGGTVTYVYDKLGRKTSETNQLGATTIYTYNAFGMEKTVKDPYGHTTEAKYDLSGNLVSFKDKRGSVTLFAYDGNRKIIEMKTPLVLDGSRNVVYAVETYAYDMNGNLIKKSLSGSKDSSFLRETTYTYYDNNLLKTESDNNGAFMKQDYDKNGNLLKTERLRETNVYDVEKFDYDNEDRMVKQIRLIDDDAFDPDSLAAATALRDEEYPDRIQVITSYAYDILGNRTKEIDPRERTVTYTYDTLNRPSKVIRTVGGTDVYLQYTYDEVGNKATERNERGMVTVYAYDEVNRVASVTDPEGHTFKYQYDLAGNKVSETNANNNSMTYAYDKLNRLVTIKDPYNVVVTRNVYDENGNLVKKIDAKGVLSGNNDEERYGIVYLYDLANQLVREADQEEAATTYRYNFAGDKVQETNALGQTYTYKYDNAGQLVQVTDPLDISVTYGYDLAGNKVNMTDGKGKVTRYRYGSSGLLLEVVNAANKPMSYRYDLALNLSEMTDRNGRHTLYAYDSRNILLEKKVVETGDLIAYTYDEKGNRASMTDESGASQYVYDKNDRLTHVVKNGEAQLTYTYDAIGNVYSVTDKKGFTTDYKYDKSSRMETVTSVGKTTTYAYDKNGNRESIAYEGGVKENYTYDRTNRLLTLKNVEPGGGILSQFSYDYDVAGRQISKTDSYGTTNYAYDKAGRIQKVEAPGKTTVYAYDNNGNRESLLETYTSEQLSGYADPNSQAEVKYIVKKSEYVYSTAGELLQLVERMENAEGVEVLKKTIVYLYDDNGNEIRQQISYLRPHTRDMRQVTGATPVGDEMTGDISSLLEKVSNTFDGFNRLKKADRIKAGERNSVEYTYDGDDLRTQKTVRSSKDGYSPKVTNYVYDRQYVILETDASDNVAVRYVHGMNYIARIDATSKLSYYLFNGHGDVVQTASETGAIENQYDYDIFGSPTLTIELYESAIRYAGEFYDAEVGLYYLRARYYDPYIGRFISEDTYEGRQDDPLSLNRYTYVLNNPLMYWDPTGHLAQGDEDLNVEAQAEIIALTSAYYNAQSKEEREAIRLQAEDIRDDKNSKNMNVVTPLQFQTAEIQAIVDYAVSQGGMTDKEWEALTKRVGIETKPTLYSVLVDTESTTIKFTTTTTIIGRTELGVQSSYVSFSNEKTKGKTEKATAELSLSYNLTSNEALFLSAVISSEESIMNFTVEEGIVLLDHLERNNGQVTKGQLISYGIKASKDDLKSLDIIEMTFHLNMNGMSVTEAEMLYLDEKAEENDFQSGASYGIKSARNKADAKLLKPLGSRVRLKSDGNYEIKSSRKTKPTTVTTTSCNCFTAGTKVLTDEGEKNIEDIEVGDKVLAKDENNPDGELAYKEVTQLFRNQRDDIIKLHVGEQIIETTDNHPFWVEGKGWVFADELQVGDKLQKADGSNLTIDKVEFVKLDEPVTVYNFAVTDYHTYYVTDLGIWVHNTGTDGSCNFTFPKSNKDMKSVFGIDDKTFHKEVKPEILKQIKNDPTYGKEFKKMGNNPDIGVDDSGNIVLKDVKTGKTLQTDWGFESFLP